MKIAVNTRFLLSDHLEGVGYFMYEVFKRITQQYPMHEFIFIFDRPYDNKFVFGKNVIPVVAGPAARHPVLWKWWYDVKVPAVLKKYKADVFVSADCFCSLKTKTPQCLVMHDLSFLHYPSFIRKSHLLYLKRYTPRFLKKATSIATVSVFSKKDIIASYKIKPDKIDIVYSASKDIFGPINEQEKEAIREKYTDGHQFFLYTGAIHPRKNLMNLLKAFSLFKKRQQNNWKLVLAGRLAWKYNRFLESLKTYKYRDDVILTGYVEETELVKITGAAYAMVYPSLWEGFGVPVLEAMKCNVPVITSADSAMQEIAGDAALYADPVNQQDIADKMMMVYKDESLRSRLIEKGKERVKIYSWDITAELLWTCITKASIKNEK
jgi:glycosyltransferase involved in cell wall biosynthesis